MNKKRAFRRRKAAMIKKIVRLEVQKWFQRWDSDGFSRWHDTDEYRQQRLRRALCNEGKGRMRSCNCDWCESGRMAKVQRTKERMQQEYAECFHNGFYVGDDDPDIEIPRYRTPFGRKGDYRFYAQVDERYH